LAHAGATLSSVAAICAPTRLKLLEARRRDGSIKPDVTDWLRPSEQIGTRMIATPPKVFLTVIQKDGTFKPFDGL